MVQPQPMWAIPALKVAKRVTQELIMCEIDADIIKTIMSLFIVSGLLKCVQVDGNLELAFRRIVLALFGNVSRRL